MHPTGMQRDELRSPHGIASPPSGSPHPHATRTCGFDNPHRDTPTTNHVHTYGASNGASTHLITTGVIATTCPACKWCPLHRFYMCTHTYGVCHPHSRLAIAILRVLTRIIDFSLHPSTFDFVYATSYTFDTSITTRLCHHSRPPLPLTGVPPKGLHY